jgi:hypothetical protein
MPLAFEDEASMNLRKASISLWIGVGASREQCGTQNNISHLKPP